VKKVGLIAIALLSLCNLVYSGTEYSGKEIRQAASPCPSWYGDNELNISLWGTYAFTGTEYAPNHLFDLVESKLDEGHTDFGTFDTYLGGDHAWGGGVDIKYFFHRYFGVGVEGFALDAKRNSFDMHSVGLSFAPGVPPSHSVDGRKISDSRIVGSVLGTLTFRYPIRCSRVSPYAWAGVGAIFGGGQKDSFSVHDGVIFGFTETLFIDTHHSGSQTELLGQFGGGLEFRFTRHIGWISDFSWNVINGAHNDFGMVRTGLNFAF